MAQLAARSSLLPFLRPHSACKHSSELKRKDACSAWYNRPNTALPWITGLVHLLSTLIYRARIVLQDPSNRCQLERAVTHVAFGLHCSDTTQTRTVDSVGQHASGLRAIHIEDNIGQEMNQPSPPLSTSTSTATGNTSSERCYIALLRCSEHEHRRCYRLLPPSPSVPRQYSTLHFYAPYFCPLPLCLSCSTVILRCIQASHTALDGIPPHNIGNVTRINSTLYQVGAIKRRSPSHFRETIVYQHRADEKTSLNNQRRRTTLMARRRGTE